MRDSSIHLHWAPCLKIADELTTNINNIRNISIYSNMMPDSHENTKIVSYTTKYPLYINKTIISSHTNFIHELGQYTLDFFFSSLSVCFTSLLLLIKHVDARTCTILCSSIRPLKQRKNSEPDKIIFIFRLYKMFLPFFLSITSSNINRKELTNKICRKNCQNWPKSLISGINKQLAAYNTCCFDVQNNILYSLNSVTRLTWITIKCFDICSGTCTQRRTNNNITKKTQQKLHTINRNICIAILDRAINEQ